MSILLWLAFALGAVLMLFAAVMLYLQGQRREAQLEVLKRLQLGPGEEEAEWIAPVQVRNLLLRGACHRLWQAGIEAEPGQVLFGLAVLALLLLLILLALGPLLGGLTAGFVLLLIVMVLRQMAGRRQLRIVAQLPDFLEYVMRALMAGNTLEEAFATAARESAEPLRGLFMGVARQVRFGAPIEDALAQVAEVHDLPDIRVLAMAARVNRRYGGSIRNMIKSLIQVIRGRGTAAHELRALTAETRFSAMLLALIPAGITLFILVRNPAYYNDMWADPTARVVLLAGFALQVVGMLVIWRMVRSMESGA